MATLKEQLFNQIETELEFCDSQTTPVICSNLEDAESKGILINTIAETAIKGKLSISQAIAEVERLYSLKDID